MLLTNKLLSSPFKFCVLLSIGMYCAQASATSPAAFNFFAGGSSFHFGNDESIVFPETSFRTDSFDINQHRINLALGAGFTYEIINCHSTSCSPGMAIVNDVVIGVNGYYNYNTRTGTVLQYGLPNFANSTYKTNLSSARLMLDGEIDFHPIKAGLTPFFEAGIGIARNEMDFQNLPVANPDIVGGYYYLDDRFLNQFAYEIGGGIKIPIDQDIVVSARYLYADAGNAKTRAYDPNTGVIIAKPIHLGVRSQSILLGFSHYFG